MIDEIFKNGICKIKKEYESQSNTRVDAYYIPVVKEATEIISSTTTLPKHYNIVEFVSGKRTLSRDFIYIENEQGVSSEESLSSEEDKKEMQELILRQLCEIPIQNNQNDDFKIKIIALKLDSEYKLSLVADYRVQCDLKEIKIKKIGANGYLQRASCI